MKKDQINVKRFISSINTQMLKQSLIVKWKINATKQTLDVVSLNTEITHQPKHLNAQCI